MEQKFIQHFTNAAAVAAGASYVPNIEAIKRDFGHNFNTLLVLNNSGEEYRVILDDDDNRALPIAANGGTLNIEAKDKLIFTAVKLTNLDGAAETAIGELRVVIGRTGAD